MTFGVIHFQPTMTNTTLFNHQPLFSKLLCFRLFDLLKAALMGGKLWWCTALFTLLGGYLFMWLERPADLAQKQRLLEDHLVSREVFLWK